MVRGFRVFSSAADATRVRRPTDVLLLVFGVLTPIALSLVAPGPTALDTAILSVVDAVPGMDAWLWELAYVLLVAWPVLLAVLALARRGRRALLGDYLLAAGLALAFAILAGAATGTPIDESMRSLLTADPPPVYVAARLAVVTAIIVTASPHVARPLRYIGRAVLVLGSMAGVALGIALPIGTLAGWAAGVAAAAVVHLVLGSPGGRPTPAEVDLALSDLGIEASDVAEASVQMSGVALFTARDCAGGALLVKVYGRDAWDGQLLTSTWTALQNRGETPSLMSGRLARIEHEAVATLLAERAGVPVRPVVAVGTSSDDDALLVSRAVGRPLSGRGSDQIDEGQLVGMWEALVRLHDLGISHGHVDANRILIRADGTPALADFGDARIAADRQLLMTDRAQLLVTQAIAVGHARSLAAAVTVIGTAGLAEVLPLLQPAALERWTRQAITDGSFDLEDLRTAAVAAAGVEPPPLLRIRRVTIKSVLTTALIAVLAYFVITRIAGIDFQSIWDELSSADFTWLLAALLVSPVIQVSFSFATLGASMAALRYWPVLMLQYAIQFIALVLPATAARLALEIRFFEKYGIAAAAAVSIGVVDSVSGFAVQIALLLIIGLSSLPGLTSSIIGSSDASTSSTDASSTPSLLALAVALVVLGAIITVSVPRLRHRVSDAIPRWRAVAAEQAMAARTSLTVLRHPAKVSQMLVGNLGAQVLQAIILGMCLHAFGYDAHLSQLILINTAVSLFAGLMPVPGGMGVAEAGYTAGLQAIGIPSAVAISTAIAFRLVTFYLPPLWGSVSMRWLRRHQYV